jgi:hypothetical protein
MITVSRVLVLAALLIFALAAVHVGTGPLEPIALGLAVYCASHLVP